MPDVQDGSRPVTRVQIAAARVQVALARRRKQPVDPKMERIAKTPMSQARRGDQ